MWPPPLTDAKKPPNQHPLVTPTKAFFVCLHTIVHNYTEAQLPNHNRLMTQLILKPSLEYMPYTAFSLKADFNPVKSRMQRQVSAITVLY